VNSFVPRPAAQVLPGELHGHGQKAGQRSKQKLASIFYVGTRQKFGGHGHTKNIYIILYWGVLQHGSIRKENFHGPYYYKSQTIALL
jgi:hypothetical protein